MKLIISTLALFLLLLGAIWQGYAQKKPRSFKEKSLITDKEVTITVSGDYRDFNRPMEREIYVQVYRRSADGLLLGNACAEDVRKKYHMQYAIVPYNHPVSGSQYFFHNFFANIKLFFKNGLFWKSRMRKKIKKCQERTADFVD